MHSWSIWFKHLTHPHTPEQLIAQGILQTGARETCLSYRAITERRCRYGRRLARDVNARVAVQYLEVPHGSATLHV